MKEIFDKGMKRTDDGIVMEIPVRSRELTLKKGTEILKFASLRGCARYFDMPESSIRYKLKNNKSINGYVEWKN